VDLISSLRTEEVPRQLILLTELVMSVHLDRLHVEQIRLIPYQSVVWLLVSHRVATHIKPLCQIDKAVIIRDVIDQHNGLAPKDVR
jgi:hypothetical protein